MLKKIIGFSVRNKFIIGVFMVAWIGWGMYSLFHLPLNTIPDLTNNQVKITTYAPDLATEEVERLITYPIEMEMGNIPGLKEIRSVSKFGLSDITLVFEDDMGMYKPRQLVNEHLKSVSKKLPEGINDPRLGPLMTGLGEIYQYVLTTEAGYDTAYSSMDLRTIQDWIVKKEMVNIDGVVGVNTMGGFLKQYEVAVSPDRLKSHDLTITDIYKALQKNNANTGGSYIEKNRKAYFIRGKGLAESLEDIRSIVLRSNNGVPLQIGDVSTVRFGHAPRFGAFTYNGKGEAVGGKVMMLRGENPAQVIKNVKERLPRVRKALPEGVVLKPFLDRSVLIKETTRTVTENLALGALIVIFLLVLLMGNIRAGLITASVIPLSLLFALGIMYTFDFSANLISLGAIDFGIIIDGALIIVEFIVFRISQSRLTFEGMNKKQINHQINQISIFSSGRMMRTAFFGQIIILIVFVPILALTGQEGETFKPMALTFGSALIGAMLLCMTYVPMMSALFLRPEKSDKPKLADRIIIALRTGYRNALRKALRYRYALVTSVLLLFGVALLLFSRMGAVFIPQLDEGDFAVHPILKPGTSLTETIRINTQLEKTLMKEFPNEVDQVATKIGTGEIPTDPMSLEMAKMIINLKPEDQWTRADTKEELEQKMKQAMHATHPGISFLFVQPIEMLFNHLLTGSTADVLLNIYGSNLDTLYKKGQQAKKIISQVPGAGNLNVQKVVGLPQIVIDYDRDQLAKYDLSIQQVNRTIQSSYAGAKAGTIYEGEKQFSLVVRLKEKARNNPENIGELYLRTPEGSMVQLNEVATITKEKGPAAISREGVKRKLEVDVNISDRDTESFINEVQKQLKKKLDLPRGYYTTYEGEFKSLQRAKQRLSWVVPLALFLIFALLYFAFNSIKQAILVFSAIPLAAIGGIFSLWLRGMPFSISAGIGFIALFGIAVLNGVVLMSFFNELKSEGMMNVFRRVYHGTDMRLRPVILTALTDTFGFLPMALSTSSGAEVQRPLATVVVGGLITATLLTLFVLPIIYTFSERIRRVPSLSVVLSKTRKRIQWTKSKVLLWVLFPLFILLYPQTGRSQSPVPDTLENRKEAVQIAIAQHPSIKAGTLDVQAEKQRQLQAWDLPDATFSFENEKGDVHVWSAQQKLTSPVEWVSRNKLAQKRIRKSRKELKRRRAKVVREAKIAFHNVLHAREKLKLMQRLEEIFKDLDKSGKQRYKTGDISYLEKVSLQSKYKAITVKKEQAETRLEKARNTLRNALYVDTLLCIKPQQMRQLQFPDHFVQKDSVLNHPSVEVARTNVQSLQAKSRTEQSKLWPDPFVKFSRWNFKTGNQASGFEIGLSVPLDFWSEKGRIQSSRLEAKKAYQNLRELEQTVHTKYQNTLSELKNYQNQLDYYQQSRLKEARMILESAKKQYKAGNIDYVQYIQYFDQAMTIKTNYLDILNQYNHTVIELEYITGTLNN